MATIAEPGTPVPLERRQVLVIFSGLLLAMLLAALDSTIVATALPTIVGELGGLERLAWVVTAYLLAQTIVTPLYGKLGDLYGRKPVLQAGIVLFLVGSMLCGMSRTMTQLILFRFIQGLGGGGLMVTTQAVVGDIIPPRDRGRYQGIFGAVFGVSSIAGPLLGGFFTTHLTWRWIFYINLPLGIAAIAVLAATLPSASTRVKRVIDYAGAALLAVVLSAVVLFSDLGGTTYPWGSPEMLGLAGVALLALVLFIWRESRAAEPILPLHLFRNRAFTVAGAVGLIVGFALFGSVTYIPLFLQVVKGSSPTGSGLQMIPMMGGMLVTSIASGQIISRTGRYKIFPVLGTAIMSLGLFLLSRMSLDISLLGAMGIMLVLGLGLGMVMQVLVIAVQNAVDYRDLGVATSGATLFRLIGGSLGTAMLGAIFAQNLARHLARLLPAGAGGGVGTGMSPEMLRRLSPAVRAAYQQAFVSSLTTVFLVATAIALTGFLLTWLLPERPLRATVAAAAAEPGQEAGEAFAMPSDPDSAQQLLRGLRVLADRDVQRSYLEEIVNRSGVALSLPAAWLLLRLEEDPSVDPVALGRTRDLPADRMMAALGELVAGGFVTRSEGRNTVTDRGCEAFNQLVSARRTHLTELVADWNPQSHEELAGMLRRIADDLVPEARRS